MKYTTAALTCAIVVLAFAEPTFADDSKARGQFETLLDGYNNQSFETLRGAIDQNRMTNRIFGTHVIEAESKAWFEENFWQQIEQFFVAVMPKKNSKKKLEIVQFDFAGGKGVAVLRYRKPGHRYVFEIFELRHDARGRLKLDDIQSFDVRQRLSSSIGEYLVSVMPTKSATRRLLANQNVTDRDLFQATELLKAYRDNDHGRFFEIYDGFEDYVKRETLIARIAAQVANWSEDLPRMEETFSVFFDINKDNTDYALAMADIHILMGQLEDAYKMLSAFEDKYEFREGSTPARLSALALALGNQEDAERHAIEATEIEPTLELGWWSLLRARAGAADYAGSTEVLEQLEDDFGHRLDGAKLRRDKYRGFVTLAESQEFEDWRATRQ